MHRGSTSDNSSNIWKLFVSEFAGTALLLSIGLSTVIFFWGKGSYGSILLPDESIRRAANGFLFGVTGCLISISKIGKVSGAHINPAVSLAFWLRGKMKTHALIGYVFAQMTGAAIGSLFLLLWQQKGKSISYGNTVPGTSGVFFAFIGEALTTSALIFIIFVFTGKKTLRALTPFTMPFLYSLMVWLEAPISGCSTNPARSFGPDLISLTFKYYWIYWLGPITGVILITGIFYLLKMHKYYHIKSARVSYHNSPTHISIRSSDKDY